MSGGVWFALGGLAGLVVGVLLMARAPWIDDDADDGGLSCRTCDGSVPTRIIATTHRSGTR